MSKKWLMLVVTLIVLLMTMPLLTACGDDDDDDDEEETKTVQPTGTVKPTETVTPTEVKEEELRMGMLTVYVTSPSAKDWSFWLAMREINAAGGVRAGDTVYKFTDSVEDDKRTSAGAVSGMQKLLYEFNADFIINQTGPVSLSARPFTEQEKVISFAWQPPDVWTGPEYPYSFTCQLDATIAVPMLLDWVSQNRPDIKTAAYISEASTQAEDNGSLYEKLAPAEYGIEIVDTAFYDFQVRDFYPILTGVLSGDHPDALIVSTSATSLFQSARDLGYEGTFIVAQDVPDYWYHMLKPEELEGMISVSINVDSPLIPQWFKNYKQAYIDWREVIPYSYLTCGSYLFVYIIAAAIEAAGTADSDAVKEVLETQTLTLKFPEGETLDVTFYGEEYYGVNHTWQPPQWISVHHDGKPEIMEEITGEKTAEYRALVESYR